MTQAPEIDLNEPKNGSNSEQTRQLTDTQLIVCAALIGAVGGLIATMYDWVLELMMHGMWHTVPDFLEPYFPK